VGIVCAFATVVIIVVGVQLAHGVKPPPIDDHFAAFQQCQDFVRSHLKAPSTAKFGSYEDATVTDSGPNQFEVSLTVDAENSFGAKLRDNVTCNVVNVGHGLFAVQHVTGLS
jgi:hypothetical protein